jgi:hypothetical protein
MMTKKITESMIQILFIRHFFGRMLSAISLDVDPKNDRRWHAIVGNDKTRLAFIHWICNYCSIGVRNKPLAMLYGPPGVGKTSLTKLASQIFNLKYIRFNMSSFRKKEDLQKLHATIHCNTAPLSSSSVSSRFMVSAESEEMCRKFLHTSSSSSSSSSLPRKTLSLIVLEECDSLPTESQMLLKSVLANVCEQAKHKRVNPVVVLGNDYEKLKILLSVEGSLVLAFHPLSITDLRKISPHASMDTLINCKGDARCLSKPLPRDQPKKKDDDESPIKPSSLTSFADKISSWMNVEHCLNVSSVDEMLLACDHTSHLSLLESAHILSNDVHRLFISLYDHRQTKCYYPYKPDNAILQYKGEQHALFPYSAESIQSNIIPFCERMKMNIAPAFGS